MDRKPLKHQATVTGKDRISDLPDPINCEILSNLPTKNAVATSILSKRWKTLWTDCTNLDFSDSLFLYNPRFILDKATETSFINFVNNVIALNKSHCIKKFKFHSNMNYESHVTTWVDSILRRDVEEMELDASSDVEYTVTLPRSLFTCKSLVSLKIASHASYDIPALIHLPSLKVLKVNLYSPSDDVTAKLFCGLPLVEDLAVSIWLYDDVEEMTLNIFTPSLKRLKLKLIKVEGFDVCDYRIVLRAPGLKELDIYDDIVADYVFEELPLDVKAKLGVGRCAAEFEDDEHAARAIQLMNGISGAKSLALSGYTLGTLDYCDEPEHVAMFPNVTCLEVGVSTSCCGYTYLPYLIDRLPNLVFLVLKMVPAHTERLSFRNSRKPLGQVPQCLLLHLKKIEVKRFDGQKNEMKLLGYLLKDAQVLDEMVIHTHNIALEERKNLCQKLSLLPCGSKNCQLKIL